MSNLNTIYTSLKGLFVSFLSLVPEIILAIIAYAIFHLAAKATRKVIAKLTSEKSSHHSLSLVLGRLAQGAIMLLGGLVALMIAVPSFKPGQLVEVLGIGSVAIGFAFRDILQNFLAGILILLTEPFRIGDQIVVAGYEGVVENIETRATFLKMYDGRRVVIPNSTLFTDSVTVNTANDKRRLQYDIGIGYGDDIAAAQQIILKTLVQLPEILPDPAPEALVVDLAGSTVNIRVRWWIAPPFQKDLMQSMNLSLSALKNALTKAGIDLPFPTQQILFHDQTEETDGNRSAQREGWPARNQDHPSSRFAIVSADRQQLEPESSDSKSRAAFEPQPPQRIAN